MTNHSDLPPTRTIEPMQPPPPSAEPTEAMLKADIDSGRTGDKNPVFDPAAAPLGADDEAAGAPPSAFRIALARRSEDVRRWLAGTHPVGADHRKDDGFPVGYVAFIGLVGLVLIVGILGVAG